MKQIGCSGRTISPGYPLYLDPPNLATMMMVVSPFLPGTEEHGGFKICLNLP